MPWPPWAPASSSGRSACSGAGKPPPPCDARSRRAAWSSAARSSGRSWTRSPAMREAVIVEAVRSPVGKRNGKLSGRHPVDLLAEVLVAAVERSGIDPARIDDHITGCVTQIGEQGVNISRNAWLAAGLPEEVPSVTIDRQCGSSQQAAHFAAQGVIAGAYD